MSTKSANRAHPAINGGVPAWLIGAIAGLLFWISAYVLLFVVIDKLNQLYPSSDLVEILQRMVAMIAIPFFFFGFELWSDEVPWWVGIIDIPFCVCFYSC